GGGQAAPRRDRAAQPPRHAGVRGGEEFQRVGGEARRLTQDAARQVGRGREAGPPLGKRGRDLESPGRAAAGLLRGRRVALRRTARRRGPRRGAAARSRSGGARSRAEGQRRRRRLRDRGRRQEEIKETAMAVRTRDWLKFGALVALAFVFGLAFASTLDLPRKGGATPLIPEAQAAGGTAFQIPAAKPDVAVIRIDARNLPTVGFGNSDSTRVGEWVLAIGNPLEFNFTVTAGIVSAKGRLLQGLPHPSYGIQDFIQTDAAINPGNSGGPLVNIQGQVIGINSAIASETGFYSGYGFAIPINLAR